MLIRTLSVVACIIFLTVPSFSQTSTRRIIRAVGTAKVSGKPDQAQIDLAVVTQAVSAQDAAAQNANQTTAVINALKQVLGANADIKTVNYSLSPVYNYPRDGGVPTLTGFTANNTVEATVGDLTLPGKIIDAAVQAGANRVDGLRFSIKDDQPLRTQALRSASLVARSHADAMALGLGVRLGNVSAAAEGYTVAILNSTNDSLAPTAAAAPTPVTPGSVDVSATVTLEIEISQS